MLPPAFKSKNGLTVVMKKYKCLVCGYVYDPALGDASSGINPGTVFENLPDDWICPICKLDKSIFERMD